MFLLLFIPTTPDLTFFSGYFILCKVFKRGTAAQGPHLHGCSWSGPDTCPLHQQNSSAPCPGTCSKTTPQLQPVTSKIPPKASRMNSQSDSYHPQALTGRNRNDRRTDHVAETQVSLCSFWSWDQCKAVQWATGKAVNAEGTVAKQKQSFETLKFQGNVDCVQAIPV